MGLKRLRKHIKYIPKYLLKCDVQFTQIKGKAVQNKINAHKRKALLNFYRKDTISLINKKTCLPRILVFRGR